METPEEQDFQTLRPSDFPSANLFINLSGGTKSIPNKALNKAKIHCAWISTLHSLHHRVRLNPYRVDCPKERSERCVRVFVSRLASRLLVFLTIASHFQYSSFPQAAFSSASLLTGVTRGGRHKRVVHAVCAEIKERAGGNIAQHLFIQMPVLAHQCTRRHGTTCIESMFLIRKKEDIGYHCLDYLGLPGCCSLWFIRVKASI